MNKVVQYVSMVYPFSLLTLLLIASSCSKNAPVKQERPPVVFHPDIIVLQSTEPHWYGNTVYFTYQATNADEVFRDGVKLPGLSGTDSITNMTSDKVVEFRATAAGKTTAIKPVPVSVHSKKMTDLCNTGIWKFVASKVLVNGVWANYTFSCQQFSFNTNGKVKILSSLCPGGIEDGTGDWYFVNNESELFLAQQPGATPWTISKLTKDSLILTVINYQGINFYNGYAHQ